ncbi:MAG: 50S ribosome-binding GTPase, partial [Clostridia bacterium]|nr:50S ribosome-binding GTPase [Clostridia bacterium]
MTKALREMEAIASKVDSVVYVLDARIPLSSVNPAYDSIFKNKPRLYVLNKADMVPQEELAKWKNFFAENGNSCIVTNSTVKGGNKIFISELKKILSPILQKYEQKGVRKTLRAMVIGVPNCGKSTLINSLVPKKRTMTGN